MQPFGLCGCAKWLLLGLGVSPNFRQFICRGVVCTNQFVKCSNQLSRSLFGRNQSDRVLREKINSNYFIVIDSLIAQLLSVIEFQISFRKLFESASSSCKFTVGRRLSAAALMLFWIARRRRAFLVEALRYGARSLWFLLCGFALNSNSAADADFDVHWAQFALWGLLRCGADAELKFGSSHILFVGNRSRCVVDPDLFAALTLFAEKYIIGWAWLCLLLMTRLEVLGTIS